VHSSGIAGYEGHPVIGSSTLEPGRTDRVMLRSPILPRDMPLFPADLDLLANVLNDLCQLRGLSRNTPQGEQIAAHLIELFRQGVKDQQKLYALANAYF
jgi:hypothetical protein